MSHSHSRGTRYGGYARRLSETITVNDHWANARKWITRQGLLPSRRLRYRGGLMMSNISRLTLPSLAFLRDPFDDMATRDLMETQCIVCLSGWPCSLISSSASRAGMCARTADACHLFSRQKTERGAPASASVSRRQFHKHGCSSSMQGSSLSGCSQLPKCG